MANKAKRNYTAGQKPASRPATKRPALDTPKILPPSFSKNVITATAQSRWSAARPVLRKAKQLHDRGPISIRGAYLGLASVVIMVAVAATVFFSGKKLFAATYTWVQSAWTGGVTANTGVHPTNETGWTEYSAKDSNVTAGASVSLTLASASKTETSDTDFNAGTKSTVAVTGSGSSAFLELSSSEGAGATVAINGVSGVQSNSKSMVYEPVTDSTWYIGTFATKTPELVQFQGDGTNGTALGSVDLSSYVASPAYAAPVFDASLNLLWVVIFNSSNGAARLIGVNPTTRAVVNNFALTPTMPSGIGWFMYDSSLDVFWLNYHDGVSPKIAKISKSGTILQTITAGAQGSGYPYSSYADASTSALYWVYGQNLYKQPKDGSAGSSVALWSLSYRSLAYDPAGQAIWAAAYGTTTNGAVSKIVLSNMSVTNYTTGFTTNGTMAITYDSYHQQMIVTTYTCCTGQKVRLSDGQVTGNIAVGGVGSTTILYDANHRVLWGNYPVAISFVTYSSPGSFTSQVLDTGTSSTYGTVSWNGNVPTNTTMVAKVRTSNSATMVGATAWGSCTGITSGQNISTGGCATNGHRYVQYNVDFTTSQASVSAKLNDISINYSAYTNGSLTSSSYDTVDATNVVGKLQWTSTGSGTVKFQLRTSPDNATWTSWLGPTGTGDYYTDNSGNTAINATNHDGVSDRYVQYKAFLISADGVSTPSLTSTTLTYVVNAPPEIQASPTAVQNADGTVTISYAVRDTDSSTDTGSVGTVAPSFEYSVDNGSHWTAITSGLAPGATNPKAVNLVTPLNYTSYTTTWTAKTQIPGTYAAQTKIRITVNDQQGANNTAVSSTAAFALDVKDPVLGSTAVYVDASTVPATIHLSASDDSTLQMCVTLDNTQSNCLAYAATTTLALATDPDTVYVIFRDAFGNTASANNVSPQTPANMVIRDISNVQTNEYQLFLTWAATSISGGQFSQYRVYGSTDGVTYSSVATIADRTVNYYFDKNLTQGSTHYYKVAAATNDGSVSYFSSPISAVANGQGGGTDVVAPIISSVAVSSITTQSANVTWSTDELSNSTIGYSTNPAHFDTEIGVASMVDRPGGVGQHSVAMTNLVPGTTYYVRVKSSDPTGNAAFDSNGGDGYTFTTLTGPTISTVTTTNIDNTTATISWVTNLASDSQVVYSTNPTLSTPTTISSATAVTSHTMTLNGLTLGTKYYYEVKSGVATETNGGAYYTFTTTQDASPPVISAITVSPITDTQAVVNWTTNERSTTQVSYGTSSGSYPTQTPVDTNLNFNHSVTLTGLTTHTTYYFVVASIDASSNGITSGEQTFLTAYHLVEETPTTTPPAISSISVSPILDTQAVVEWTTDVGATSRVDYGLASGHLTTHVGPDSSLTLSHALTLPNLTAHTTYFYTVTSTDRWGNIGTSTEQTFTTQYALVEQTPSTVAPIISSISAEPITDTTAVIHWVTDILASTQVSYGPSSGAYPTVMPIDQSLNLTHMATVNKLTPSTTYYYVVTSTDRWGNTMTSDEQHFTTSEPLLPNSEVEALVDAAKKSVKPDTTLPILTAIAANTIGATEAEIDWTTDEPANSFVQFWTAANDQLVFGNWVYDQQHAISLLHLTPNTAYTYRVISADLNGNTAISPEASFRTLTLPVTALQSQLQQQVQDIQQQAQSLPGPVIGGQPKVDVTPTSATISWSTDKPANSLVAYATDSEYSSHQTYAQTVGDPDHFLIAHSVKIGNLSENTVYHFQIKSTTDVGQSSSTVDTVFQTPKKTFAIDNYSVDTPDTQTAVFRWTTNDNASATVEATPYRNNVLAVDELKTGADSATSLIHQVSLSTLEPGTRYRIELISTNANKLRTSKTIDAFSTSSGGEPPVISQIHIDSALSPGEKVKVQTIVSWTTDSPSTSQVFFSQGVGKAGSTPSDSTALDASYGKHHVVVITSFVPGAVYQLRVESKNSNGQTATSKTLTTLTPQLQQTVFQVITNTFTQVFGWTKIFSK